MAKPIRIKDKDQLKLNFKQPKYRTQKQETNSRLILTEIDLDKLSGLFRKQYDKYNKRIAPLEMRRKKENVKKILLKIIEIKSNFENIKANERFMQNEANKRYDPKEITESRIEIEQEHKNIYKKEKELIELMKDANYSPQVIANYIKSRPSLILRKNYNKSF